MRITCWNVNGIRAVSRAGFWDWLAATQPDVACLQETRIQPDQLTAQMLEPPGYHTYWHAGQRSQERVIYKLDFYDALLGYCEELRARGQSLIVCGDWNTAHQPIDLARPKENVKNSGFLPEERDALSRWMERGWVDAFRALYPDKVAYTWWSQITGARARDIEWRIDMFLVTPELMSFVEDVAIFSEVMGSDHCPVELRLSL